MRKDIKILYVDDDFLNLLSFEVLLKDKFIIFTVSNVAKAFEIFNQNYILVVITDQKMPKKQR